MKKTTISAIAAQPEGERAPAYLRMDGHMRRIAAVRPARAPSLASLYEVWLVGVEGALFASPDAIAFEDDLGMVEDAARELEALKTREGRDNHADS